MEGQREYPETTVHDTENGSSHADDLLSSFATAEIPPDISDAPQRDTPVNSARHGLEAISESSPSSSRRHSAETEGFLDDDVEEDGQIGTKSAASSRSSLSSIPDSVVVRSKEQSLYGRESMGSTSYGEQDYTNYDNPVYQKIRDRSSPFRHPSSVKAIQMQTEDEEDEDFKSPSRRRGAGFLGSPASARSSGSPLLRRQGYHSAGGTPKKSPVKRENPLVLLHCTILPPTVVLGPGVSLPDRKILKKVLPPEYWRRWRLLEEKIVASGLLRDRGLLIQHPQEDYGLLEERVLESLELQRPRLENGHFIKREESDSENEGTEESPTYKYGGAEHPCADCGCHVNRHDEQRKWDIKFYAANGLMKEGAWTAAWKEIERVDVQVSLWLPYEVKTEVEEKIHKENLVVEQEQRQEEATTQPMMNEREPKIQKHLSQDKIDGLDDGPAPQKNSSRHEASGLAYPTAERMENRRVNQDAELPTLLINSLRVLASDRRNIITAVSMLVAILAVVFGGRQGRRNHYGADLVQFGDFPAVSTQVYYSSSTSILTQASTEIPLPETENGVEGPGEIQRVAQGVKEEHPAHPTHGFVVHSSMQSDSQQQSEPAIETREANLTETLAFESHIGIPESTHSEQAVPEPSSYSTEIVDHEIPKPSSVPEHEQVDRTSSDETEPHSDPPSESIPAAVENDNDEAT